jgi:hypothetical protein
MYPINPTVISKLQAQITERRLNRVMSAICDHPYLWTAICAAAVYVLIMMPLHRMVMP